MPARHITLTIDSRLEDVALAGIAVHRLCGFSGLSEQTSCWMELCVVEALNNSIRHAYGCESGHTVEVSFTVHEDRVQLDVSDCGVAMDPGRVGAARETALEFDPDDLETLPVGGMGLGLIAQTMDVVHYSSANGKNTLTMVKYFGTDKTAP